MIVEAKQQYRGVLCLHCHQPIPLSSSTAANEEGFGEQQPSGGNELIVRSLSVRSFTERSFAMRCRVCEGEGLYTGFRRDCVRRNTENKDLTGTQTPY
jgi:hypothetical protein